MTTRAEAVYRYDELMGKLRVSDLTYDELTDLAEILGCAWQRKQEPIVPGVVYLDLVRSLPRRRELQ